MLTRRALRLRRRPGFTLAEVLVAVTVLGVFGTIFTRFLLSQARFTEHQHALRGARMVSRQALNILESELRMVQDSGGLDSVSADGRAIRARVPYRYGLNCSNGGSRMAVSMLPVDSLALAQARYAGYAWRGPTGRYTFVFPAAPLGADAPIPATDPAQCWGTRGGDAQIRTITINGRSGSVLDIFPPAAPAKQGWAVFFFQRVTYAFQPSAAFPGSYGLYRSVQGGTSEEIMAPFDSTSRFKFWTRGAEASVAAPPPLSDIRGIDVVFAGRSVSPLRQRSSPVGATVVASIFFRNVR